MDLAEPIHHMVKHGAREGKSEGMSIREEASGQSECVRNRKSGFSEATADGDSGRRQ